MDLRSVGLDEDDQRVYVALVARPHTTASALAAGVGLSTQATARVLGGLVEKELATRAGRPARYSSTPPDDTLLRLVRHRTRELDQARSLAHRLAESHREARRLSAPDVAMELLTDPEAISAAARRLARDAERQVRVFDRPPYVDRPGSNLDVQLERQRSGVVHRVIYSPAAVSQPGRWQNDIVPSIEAGECARVRGELALKLVIRDDIDALIPFSEAHGGHLRAYLVHRSPMLSALEALFEAEWERAADLDASQRPDGRPSRESSEAGESSSPPDEETRTILSMLAAGLTDAAVARALGWSPRTTQRRIQRAMQSLGTTNRFQAAVIASRRGWV